MPIIIMLAVLILIFISGGSQPFSNLDASRIDRIEISLRLGDITLATIYDAEQISAWVGFFTSLNLTADADGLPNAARPGTTFIIYHANGGVDIIDYHYTSLFYNGRFYWISDDDANKTRIFDALLQPTE